MERRVAAGIGWIFAGTSAEPKEKKSDEMGNFCSLILRLRLRMWAWDLMEEKGVLDEMIGSLPKHLLSVNENCQHLRLLIQT